MISLRRILAPTDFSTCSQKALAYATAFAEKFGAELHVVHVVEDLSPLLPASGLGLPVLTEAIREIHEKADAALAALNVGDSSVKVVKAIRNGLPHQEIAAYAKETEVDLIVLGTHGRSGFVHVLLGSIAEKTVRHAPCPVLTVRHDNPQ